MTGTMIRMRKDPSLTRGSYGMYSLDELRILRGKATHADLVWTGERWLIEIVWRGEPLPPEPPMISSHPDSGEVLRRTHWEIVGMPPDYEAVEPGYFPRGTNFISSRAFMGVRDLVFAHPMCDSNTYVLARIDQPELLN